MILSDISIKRPVFATMMMVALVVLTGDHEVALESVIPPTTAPATTSPTSRRVVPDSPDATDNPDSIPGRIEEKLSPEKHNTGGAVTRPATKPSTTKPATLQQ